MTSDEWIEYYSSVGGFIFATNIWKNLWRSIGEAIELDLATKENTINSMMLWMIDEIDINYGVNWRLQYAWLFKAQILMSQTGYESKILTLLPSNIAKEMP